MMIPSRARNTQSSPILHTIIFYRQTAENDKGSKICKTDGINLVKTTKEKPQGEKTEKTKGQQFTPGGIHKSEVLNFWKHELNANQWVMDVLENGYVIPFEKAPIQYEEDNNKSAKTNAQFVRTTLTELEKIGVVKFVDEKPFCVSPQWH